MLGAGQVTVGKLAYRLSAPLHKTGLWSIQKINSKTGQEMESTTTRVCNDTDTDTGIGIGDTGISLPTPIPICGIADDDTEKR